MSERSAGSATTAAVRRGEGRPGRPAHDFKSFGRKLLSRSVRPLAVLCALGLGFALVGCATKDEEQPASTSTSDDAKPAIDDQSGESTDGEDDLAALQSELGESGIACEDPHMNTSPDPSNLYLESMSCLVGGLDASFYRYASEEELRDSVTVEVGEPCSVDEHPFTPGMDRWDGVMVSGAIEVNLGQPPADDGSPRELFGALEAIAEAADWDLKPLCHGPV